ncbi:MAG: NEL-type E3 ubiquitin ligase domain-containing protein [Candidatus Rhabdochlamydia sp.]
MQISNHVSLVSHSLNPSLDFDDIEYPYTLLAEEFYRLISWGDLPRHILIRGDVEINSSHIHAVDLLHSRNVKIEGSLTCQDLPLTQFPGNLEVGKDLRFSKCEALTTLPNGLKVKGSLNFSGCKGLKELPEDLEVGEDLILYECEALTTMPKWLKVKGCLNLFECTGLKELPKDLEIEEDLTLSGCKALTTMPKRLKIKGNLDLSDCTQLKELLEDLEVGKNFTIYNCEALTTMPKRLKVKGYLELCDCKELKEFPEDLEVEEDLILSKCEALTTMPKRLKVKGRLKLCDCKGLNELPEDLEVEEDLILSYCKALTKMPKRLKVKGELDLSYCTGLKKLPEDLEVEKDLNLSHCTALTTMPKRLKVKGCLNLFECTGLKELPEDLKVEQDLDLSHCTALTTLPNGLKIKGHLYLFYCTSLTHLPEDLKVEKNLYLSHCTGLTTLPHSLELGGNLDLSECTYLTSLPNWIATLGSCSNGNIREIHLTGCGLSHAVITRLQEDTQDVAGIRIYFSLIEEEEYLNQFEDLFQALTFWQELIKQDMQVTPKEMCNQLHRTLTGIQDHQNLFNFLMRLTKTADYYNGATRKDLARRVFHMLGLMTQDKVLSQHIATLIHQGLSSCDDRISATLSDIGFYQKLRALQHESVTFEEVKSLGRGFFYLEKLNKKITLYIKTLHFVDEVEVHMAFHIRLQGLLNLPIDTKEMLFRQYVCISDEEIDRIGREVLEETTEAAFEAFLDQWDPWKQHQRRISIPSWEHLPTVYRPLLSTDSCPYLQDTPERPVLYNNVVYDYEAFIKRYIQEGVDLYNVTVQIEKLLRIESSFNIGHVSGALNEEGIHQTEKS